MMITIVEFTAFSSKGEKTFIDKTDEEIKQELTDLCNTYHETGRRKFEAIEVGSGTNQMAIN